MKVTTLCDASYASNCYLVSDDAGTGTILIDPSLSPSVAEGVVGALPRIDRILLTHGHFDHMLALDAWRRLTGAPLFISSFDAPALTSPDISCYRSFLHLDTVHAPADGYLAAGDRVEVGQETLTVLEVPGHTPGSLSFDSGSLLFTGDTLFAHGGYGRYDLPGGDVAQLAASLRALLTLSGERRIFSGHGEETTLSEAKKYFNFLRG